jgi:hypothetical protein
MNTLPQTISGSRPPRVRFAESTPAVVRFQDGRRATGQLQIVSLTGGLLSVPKPLVKGSQVKVMFLTDKGPVLGAAEMLEPVTWGQQPFRFVSLGDSDRRVLGSAIQSSLRPAASEEDWIEKYRAATLTYQEAPGRPFLRMLVGVFTLLCLGSMFYLVYLRH